MLARKKLLAVLALIAVAGVYLYFNLGGMITRQAERIASDALGVKVTIGSIDVSLGQKKVTVNSLKIANPPGYHTKHAMTAEHILIGLNSASKQLIDFNDIRVKGSVVNLEVNEKGVNLYDLKALASRREQREKAGSEEVRVIIQRMVIEASTVNASVSLLDREVKPLSLPPINFSGLGKGGGLEADDAIVQVLGKYLTAAERAARQQGLLGSVPGMGDAEKLLDGVGKGIKDLF